MARCRMLLAWSVVSVLSTVALAEPNPVRQADALLSIDQHRATVIDRIVTEWGDRLLISGAGATRDRLREMLFAMRADQLLAASLAGSVNGLRDVLANAMSASAKSGSVPTKSLGDSSDDVVYTPVTPCRLVETRGSFAAVYQGDGSASHVPIPFAPNETRNYTVQGGNGVCLTQIPAGLTLSAVQLQVFGIPINAGSNGDVEVLPQGSSFGSTATLVYLGNILFTSASTTALINLSNNQIGVQVRGGGAHVAIDVVGYFKRALNNTTGAFEVAFNGNLALQITPDAFSTRIVAGSNANSITAGAIGAVVGGGGAAQAFETTFFSCSGSCANRVTDAFGTVAGGLANQAGDAAGSATDKLFATVGGGFHNVASGDSSTIAGGFFNIASGRYSIVAGGFDNTASGNASFVGGGAQHTAEGVASTVGGGDTNWARADGTTIGGGTGNHAGGPSNSGQNSTVGGGYQNSATGPYSTIPGGQNNIANGQFGFAAGSQAHSTANGEFVWADSNPHVFDPSILPEGWVNPANTFNARATGGIWFVSGVNASGTPLTGCFIGAGSSSWACTSSRDAKTDFENVDVSYVLRKVIELPIETWRLKTEPDAMRHMGPMAQDFYAAFTLGHDDKSISMLDAQGVALAAIQGLNQVVQEKDARIAVLEQEVSGMRGELAALRATISEIASTRDKLADR